MRKAFSMIKLLFVMITIAALIAIVVPNYKAAKDNMYILNMKNDVVTAIDTINSKYLISEDYRTILPYDSTMSDDDDDGYTDITLLDNTTRLPVSEYSSIVFTENDCDADGYANDGFVITVSNPNVSKYITFDSCLDNEIKVN
jgi:type II secretory pathway pseudopilin PulG